MSFASREGNGASGTIQRKCASCEDEDETNKIHAKRDGGTNDSAAMDTSSAIAAAQRPGLPLPRQTRAFFEPRMGADLSSVRIHTDAEAARAAAGVQAKAYTWHNKIVFGAGEYAPETDSGKRLLAHELMHWRQQAGGSGTMQSMLARKPKGDVEEKQLARPNVTVVADGHDDVIVINGVHRAFRVRHVAGDKQVERVSGGGGRYVRLLGREFSRNGTSVSWEWAIPLVYKHRVAIDEIPSGMAAVRNAFPSVLFRANATVQPEIPAGLKRALAVHQHKQLKAASPVTLEQRINEALFIPQADVPRSPPIAFGEGIPGISPPLGSRAHRLPVRVGESAPAWARDLQVWSMPNGDSILQFPGSPPLLMEGALSRERRAERQHKDVASFEARWLSPDGKVARIKELTEHLWTGSGDEERIINILRYTAPDEASKVLNGLKSVKFGDRSLLDKLDEVVDGDNNVELHAEITKLRDDARKDDPQFVLDLVNAPVLPWRDSLSHNRAVFTTYKTSDGRIAVTYGSGQAYDLSHSEVFGAAMRALPEDLQRGLTLLLQPDDIVIVNDYDGNRHVRLTASDLIAFEHSGNRGMLGHIVNTGSVVIPVGLAARGTMGVARATLEVGLAALAIGAQEYRLELTKWSPGLVSAIDLANMLLALKGGVDLTRAGAAGVAVAYARLKKEYDAFKAVRDAKIAASGNANAKQIADLADAQANALLNELELLRCGLLEKREGLVKEPFPGGFTAIEERFNPILDEVFPEDEPWGGFYKDRSQGTQFNPDTRTINFKMDRSMDMFSVAEEVQHAIDYTLGANQARTILNRARKMGIPDSDIVKWWHRRVFTRMIKNIHAERYGLEYLKPRLVDVHGYFREIGGKLTLEELLATEWKGLYRCLDLSSTSFAETAV